MKLTIGERLVLQGSLPPDGDLRTMRVVQELHRDLGLTAEEIEAWNVKSTDKTVTWGWHPSDLKDDPDLPKESDMEAEIDVAGVKTAVVVETLRALDSEKKLTANHLSLCEKFPFEQD